MNVVERRLWFKLRGRHLGGWKFRRQHPIGPYVVDFYCPASRLVIELNGSSHVNEAQFEHDERRRGWLASHGYKVLTFSADADQRNYVDGVWDTIELELSKVPASPPRLRRTSPRSGEE